MIHQALADWDGTSDLTTPAADGSKSLIFKMNNVDELRITFNSMALITGGLHPTQTDCVKGAGYATWGKVNGRWRNGSLTMHLVDLNLFRSTAFTDGDKALDRLRVQTPTDFQEIVYPGGNGIALTDEGDDNIVNGGAPDYEIYGGLTADPDRADSGFLYESTMFWHFDDDSLHCYGQPGWAEDYLVASQFSVAEIFYEALERTGANSVEELAAIVDALVDQGCEVTVEISGDKDDKDPVEVVEYTDCQKEYITAAETLAMGRLLEANGITVSCSDDGCLGDLGDGDGGGSGTSLSGDPLAIVGGLDEAGITSGPNFEAGRRTWIDILPE